MKPLLLWLAVSFVIVIAGLLIERHTGFDMKIMIGWCSAIAYRDLGVRLPRNSA